MAYEIIYVCNSINNKNVREGELNILEKYEEQLYFVFGSDEMNTKKRFYNNLETLNKDFNALLKLKEKESSKESSEESSEVSRGIGIKEVFFEEPVEIKEVKKEPKKTQKEEKKDKYKIIKRKK